MAQKLQISYLSVSNTKPMLAYGRPAKRRLKAIPCPSEKFICWNNLAWHMHTVEPDQSITQVIYTDLSISANMNIAICRYTNMNIYGDRNIRMDEYVDLTI